MPKVTYIIGAGASSGCLPVINGIHEYLDAFRQFLLECKFASELSSKTIVDFGQKRKFGEIHAEIIDECQKLIKNVREHASIDTYAKKLLITKGKHSIEYLRLKALMSIFFIWAQRGKTDPRYDSFFASVIGTNINELSRDIRILSWNYDYQFEKAFSLYSQEPSLEQNQRWLNVFTPLHVDTGMKSEFSLFKINGTTGFAKNQAFYNHYDDLIAGDGKLPDLYVQQYADCVYYPSDYKMMLSFAWETQDQILDKFMSSVKTSCGLTETVVIIGYSFPYFNRSIDRKIMSMFDNTKKIYIQDLYPDTVESRIKNLIKIRSTVIPISVDSKSPGQFFIPPEI